MKTTRFTRDGSATLEQQLADICHHVGKFIQQVLPASALEGIALGGGYGRGEGGVLFHASYQAPYNDMEFFVFVRGPLLIQQIRWNRALQDLAHRLTERYGIEIEFKLLTLAKLRRSEPSMFYYDLVMGHHWVMGDDSLFVGCEHHQDPSTIPLHEVTRLLMNRSSGLLFAKVRLSHPDFTAEDADFVARNLAKAQLALGDVLLATHGQYHWSCIERHRRLQCQSLPFDFSDHHAAGVEFKLHPTRSSAKREELVDRHQSLTTATKTLFLWLESRRLGVAFPTLESYANSTIDKCPETQPTRNRLINFRQFGVRSLNNPRYPRQRLLHGLCDLLWGASTDQHAISAYVQLWQRFN
ncbi:hypothetical protein BH11VER1_BH11VER1_19840 [soil metagenome]